MKLYHPTIPGKSVDVPRAAEKSWREQGWRKTPPKTTGAATAADQGQRTS